MPLREGPHRAVQRCRKVWECESSRSSKPERTWTSSRGDTEAGAEACRCKGLLDTNLRVHINTYLFRACSVRRLSADLQCRNATGLGAVRLAESDKRPVILAVRIRGTATDNPDIIKSMETLKMESTLRSRLL